MSETLQNVFSRKKADPTQHTQNATLFEKLGGAPAVSTAVDVFYRKVVRDSRINYFFFGVNITEQAEKQKAFLTMAFGGPHHYTGRDMHKSHAKLVNMGMNDRHFDIVMDHLKDTLVELGVDMSLVDEVLSIAESTREDVMGRRQPQRSPTRQRHPEHPQPAQANVQAQTSMNLATKPTRTVGSILEGQLVTLNPETPVTDAMEVFVKGRYASLPVVDAEGRLLGIVTATDLIKHRPR